MKIFFNVFYCLITFILYVSPLYAQKIISIHGSSTFSNILLVQHKEEIEKRANVSLNILANNSYDGFLDLTLDRCDIAMISAPLQLFIDNFNEHTSSFVRANAYTQFIMGETTVVFIVNKNNPIDYLSSTALRKICVGDILNWKDIGGKDMRIIFFTTPRGDGIRTSIEEILLKGDFFGIYTTVLRNAEVVNSMVAHLPEAIGTNNINEVDDSVKIVKTDIALTQSLSFVTKVNPRPELLNVINSLKDILNENSPKPKN